MLNNIFNNLKFNRLSYLLEVIELRDFKSKIKAYNKIRKMNITEDMGHLILDKIDYIHEENYSVNTSIEVNNSKVLQDCSYSTDHCNITLSNCNINYSAKAYNGSVGFRGFVGKFIDCSINLDDNGTKTSYYSENGLMDLVDEGVKNKELLKNRFNFKLS